MNLQSVPVFFLTAMVVALVFSAVAILTSLY